MTRIAFIGAGSYGFTHRLVGDLLTSEYLHDARLSFMDIDRQRLDRAEVVVRRLIENRGLSLDLLFTLDRDRALEGADFVINLVKIGMLPPSYMDIDLPKKYGLQQTIGDTSCVAGVFRGLRVMPWVIDLCADIERRGAQLYQPPGSHRHGLRPAFPGAGDRAVPQRPGHHAADCILSRSALRTNAVRGRRHQSHELDHPPGARR